MTQFVETAHVDDDGVVDIAKNLSTKSATVTNKKPKRANKPQPRLRDEVFWTELEIRRLSNLVAEGIHSRRYIGDSLNAVEERQQMRVYIDAMKRKAMRVLHRAELFACSAGAAWPGIDRSISDPVSLADEYVRLVENYLGVVNAEEERVRKELAAKSNNDEEKKKEEEEEEEEEEGEEMNGGPLTTEDVDKRPQDDKQGKEDWEVEDESAYRRALEESKQNREDGGKSAEEETTSSEDNKRTALLSGAMDADGIRQRRTGGADGDAQKEATQDNNESVEEVMARNRPVQDELTSKLVDMVGQLKESVTENQMLLDKDQGVMDQAEDAVDKNVDSLTQQRKRLGTFSQRGSTSWWTMLIAAFVIVLVFVFVFALLAAPM